ncbi:MerR family transcriptional regulator [Streptomyces canus]|uniref:MerR family transcriptional regulator n=1 Tax=Streptomyces canus TaxID=58343 RepID=UPI003866696A|nr:MerR family transcriptional regulator [Streptomyces canus]
MPATHRDRPLGAGRPEREQQARAQRPGYPVPGRFPREANNYRDYDETALGRVQQVRELLGAGLSTEVIRAILPCMESPRDPSVFDGILPETVSALEAERDRLTERIDVLTRNRDAVATYLGELEQRAR